jgi:branched-chain amino acid transport system ATP-binding protein
MNVPIIEARGVSAGYGASQVLRGVDLAVHAGETIGLMGRNGMGKTTLIRTLLGLLPTQGGTVLMDGVDATTEPAFRRAQRGIATVPENRGVFAGLSVTENLRLAARPGAWSEQRVLSLFPRLRERNRHRGNQLSGGEQQMLAIGRALMTNPRLLILDEATEGLAPLIRMEISSPERDSGLPPSWWTRRQRRRRRSRDGAGKGGAAHGIRMLRDAALHRHCVPSILYCAGGKQRLPRGNRLGRVLPVELRP